MGVYIRDMEKPNYCWQCPINNCDYREENMLSDDCPLIEIDDEAIDIAQDIMDGCKELKERVDKGIVRCGECKHYDFGLCSKLHLVTDSKNFCSDGERRANE